MAATTKMASRMECTVVMVGDARTGKTAMVRRLTEDNFDEVRTKRQKLGSYVRTTNQTP